jgi:L-lactate permease
MRALGAILAVVLFFPGACFALVAFSWPLIDGSFEAWPLLLIAAVIFAVMYFLDRYSSGEDTHRQ